jgi:hypothetical protein
MPRPFRIVLLICLVALAAAACSGDEDAAIATTTTSGVATGPLELVVTYDGEACAYSGPDRATLDDEISLTFVNESEDSVFVSLRQIPPDRIDELEQLVGTDFDWTAQTDIEPSLYADQFAGPGQETTSAFLAVPGTYVVDCTLFDNAGVRLHTWWPAALEVTR